MKKIVINSQHGGFSLSAYAIKEYADRKGLLCFFFKTDFYKDSKDRTVSRYERVNIHDAQADWFFSAFTVDNPNEHKDLEWDEWKKLCLSSKVIDRDDPDLIATIEKLGEAANSRVCTFKIVEIPDDVEWCIQEYDGLEWVAEKHRTWS